MTVLAARLCLFLVRLAVTSLLLMTSASAQDLAATDNTDTSLAALFAELHADMRVISAGEFRMGDLSGKGNANERPAHEVRLKSFRLATHEVTFKAYDAFAIATNRPRPASDSAEREHHPAVNVSWHDAQDFIAWLRQKTGRKYRLPSEAEWEYAARAGSSSLYPWGDEYDTRKANGRDGDRWQKTSRVGAFPANAWGLRDMIGNVWEWVDDCWNESYQGAPADGSAWRSGDCSRNVTRGGSWVNSAANLTASFRFWFSPNRRYFNLGFRLAEDL